LSGRLPRSDRENFVAQVVDNLGRNEGEIIVEIVALC
jgi:hypothetical protein